MRAQKLVFIRLCPRGSNEKGNGCVVFLFSEPLKTSKRFEVRRNHLVNLSFIRVLWISDVFKIQLGQNKITLLFIMKCHRQDFSFNWIFIYYQDWKHLVSMTEDISVDVTQVTEHMLTWSTVSVLYMVLRHTMVCNYYVPYSYNAFFFTHLSISLYVIS